MRRAAVASGLLDQDIADLLAKDEIEPAMTSGWGPDGSGPEKVLLAAPERARGSADFSVRKVLGLRRDNRCGAFMVRAKSTCVRRAGSPRSTPFGIIRQTQTFPWSVRITST